MVHTNSRTSSSNAFSIANTSLSILSGSSISIGDARSSTSQPVIEATCIEKLFSPFGANTSPIVVYYVMYDWASKVTVFAFNICIPLLITKLGNEEFGGGKGKIVYTYLSSITYVVTALCFITFTSIIEYGNTKRDALIQCGVTCSIALLLFALCIYPQTIYLALSLSLISRVLFNIGNVAFDALLDGVTEGIRDAHQISSRSFLTGYLGMVCYVCTITPLLYIFYYVVPMRHSLRSFVIDSVVPLASIGLWYLLFTLLINRHFPKEVGVGPPFPIDKNSAPDEDVVRSVQIQRQHSENSDFSTESNSVGVLSDVAGSMRDKLVVAPLPPLTCWQWLKGKLCSQPYRMLVLIRYGFVNGTIAQWENVKELHKFPDLALFFLSFVFINGALNTAITIAAIVVADIFNANSNVLVICVAVGVFTAITGLFCFRYLHKEKYLLPKSILIINTIILAAMAIYLLFASGETSSLIIIAAIGGSQIGSVGAFSRSIVSRLIPTERQSRLFTFYQFSQEATSWIGPLVIASVATASGGENSQFVFISVMVVLGEIAIGLPLLCMINFTKGEDTRDLMDRLDSVDAAIAREEARAGMKNNTSTNNNSNSNTRSKKSTTVS